MKFHHTKHQRQLLFCNSKTLTALLLIITLLMVAPAYNINVVSANELNPTDQIKPTHSKPSLNTLPDRADLNPEGKNPQQIADHHTQTKPSWWNWLTNASKKPASYHFIDMLELLN